MGNRQDAEKKFRVVGDSFPLVNAFQVGSQRRLGKAKRGRDLLLLMAQEEKLDDAGLLTGQAHLFAHARPNFRTERESVDRRWMRSSTFDHAAPQ